MICNKCKYKFEEAQANIPNQCPKCNLNFNNDILQRFYEQELDNDFKGTIFKATSNYPILETKLRSQSHWTDHISAMIGSYVFSFFMLPLAFFSGLNWFGILLFVVGILSFLGGFLATWKIFGKITITTQNSVLRYNKSLFGIPFLIKINIQDISNIEVAQYVNDNEIELYIEIELLEEKIKLLNIGTEEVTYLWYSYIVFLFNEQKNKVL